MEDCVRLGLQNNRSLHTAQLRAGQASARQDEAFAALLPTLKASAGYTRVSDVPDFTVTIPLRPYPATMTLSQAVLNNYQAKLSLQQPLFTGDRLTANYSLQRSGAEAARSDVTAQGAELAFQIRSAYWNLFQARQVSDVVEDNIHQVEAHLRDVENLARQGMATDNDRLKVQLQLSNAQLMRIDAANAVRVAEIGLNNLTGRPLESAVIIASAVDTAGQEAAPLAEEQQRAIASRPELKAMQSRVAAGNSGVRMALAGWYPQVLGTANYTYARPNQRIFPAKDQFDATWDVGVALSFDVWNWRATAHQVSQARAQLAQAQEALAQARDGV
ncbi:MAG TPA: TolC family protein, partial [Candidatus Edwardsbacteria bacterium]|nr:TolC family protein [Candidatus Edwardsbacteria bacterium]